MEWREEPVMSGADGEVPVGLKLDGSGGRGWVARRGGHGVLQLPACVI